MSARISWLGLVVSTRVHIVAAVFVGGAQLLGAQPTDNQSKHRPSTLSVWLTDSVLGVPSRRVALQATGKRPWRESLLCRALLSGEQGLVPIPDVTPFVLDECWDELWSRTGVANHFAQTVPGLTPADKSRLAQNWVSATRFLVQWRSLSEAERERVAADVKESLRGMPATRTRTALLALAQQAERPLAVRRAASHVLVSGLVAVAQPSAPLPARVQDLARGCGSVKWLQPILGPPCFCVHGEGCPCMPDYDPLALSIAVATATCR